MIETTCRAASGQTVASRFGRLPVVAFAALMLAASVGVTPPASACGLVDQRDLHVGAEPTGGDASAETRSQRRDHFLDERLGRSGGAARTHEGPAAPTVSPYA